MHFIKCDYLCLPHGMTINSVLPWSDIRSKSRSPKWHGLPRRMHRRRKQSHTIIERTPPFTAVRADSIARYVGTAMHPPVVRPARRCRAISEVHPSRSCHSLDDDTVVTTQASCRANPDEGRYYLRCGGHSLKDEGDRKGTPRIPVVRRHLPRGQTDHLRAAIAAMTKNVIPADL